MDHGGVGSGSLWSVTWIARGVGSGSRGGGGSGSRGVGSGYIWQRPINTGFSLESETKRGNDPLGTPYFQNGKYHLLYLLIISVYLVEEVY